MGRTGARAARYERGRLVFDLLANQLGQALLPLAFLFFAGLVIGVASGFGAPAALVLIAGSIASGFAMLVTAWPSVRRAYGLQATWTPLAALAGLVPYVFGLYAFFVAGAWNPVRDRTLRGAGMGLFFLLVGFWYLRGYSRLASLIDGVESALAGAGAGPAPAGAAEGEVADGAVEIVRPAVARAGSRGGSGRVAVPGPALAAGMRRTGS